MKIIEGFLISKFEDTTVSLFFDSRHLETITPAKNE